ncbi:hydroxyacid dehydrogenase [Puniceicoccaceae bacterium K14]|nr:hydroxyacid dehydrogenase [Puniceicoccaceae bacterium K14]
MKDFKPKAIYIMHDYAFEAVYSDKERQAIAELLDIPETHSTADSVLDNLDCLRDVEIIVSSWGGPKLDQRFLNAAPKLKAIFYGAGSIRYMATPEFWESGVRITSAASANAIPVSEFALSQILFSLKSGWQHVHARNQGIMDIYPLAGTFRSTVGLISMGVIAKLVRKLLKNFDINVLAYDPFMSNEDAQKFDVELVSLDELFRRSNVVSLHTPDLPETKRMIRKKHFEVMPEYSTFINTARSATVDHTDLCDVLETRPDICAMIDVTEKATDEEHQRMIKLPNVSLTPHIAGSLGKERERLGQYVIEEIRRFLNAQPLEHEVTEEKFQRLA